MILSIALGGAILLVAGDPQFAKPMSADQARQKAQKLLEARAGLPPADNRFPMLIEPREDWIRGIARDDGSVEVILVPDDGVLVEPDHPLLGQEKGLPIGWLFVRGLKIAGLAESGVRRVTVMVNDTPVSFSVLQLGARQIAPGEYRLEGWSQLDRPVFAVDWLTTRTRAGAPLDLDEATGTLTLYALGRFAAFIPVTKSASPLPPEAAPP